MRGTLHLSFCMHVADGLRSQRITPLARPICTTSVPLRSVRGPAAFNSLMLLLSSRPGINPCVPPHHSEIVSPRNFPLILHLPCVCRQPCCPFFSLTTPQLALAIQQIGRHSCLQQQGRILYTYIGPRVRVRHEPRHEDAVHEADKGDAWCPAEVPPAVFHVICWFLAVVSFFFFLFCLRLWVFG